MPSTGGRAERWSEKVRHGQAVQREHAKHRRNSSKQNRHFKSDDNKGRPGMRGLASNVEGVVDCGHPILHQVSGQAADDAADEDDQRNLVTMEADFFCQPFDGKRAVGIDLLVTCLVRGARGLNQRSGRIELRHDAVDGITFHLINLAINLDTALAIIPSPPPRAAWRAFQRSKSQAGCARTGT